MQETLYQTADAGDSLSDSGCRRHSIRHRLQEYLFQTADAGDSLSDSGCRRLSIGQRMQETLYLQRMQASLHQTADSGDSLSNSGCMSNRVSPASAVRWRDSCIRCLIESILHPLFERETPASAV